MLIHFHQNMSVPQDNAKLSIFAQSAKHSRKIPHLEVRDFHNLIGIPLFPLPYLVEQRRELGDFLGIFGCDVPALALVFRDAV